MLSLFLSSLCVLCVSAVSSYGLDDPELQRLRKAGDLKQVERYCREELRKTADVDRRAELTAELAASLAQQANAATDADSSRRSWDEADQVLAGFLKSHGEHPRASLLLRQRVIYAYTHGESLRRQAEIVSSEELPARARALLRLAEEQGRALESRVQKDLDDYSDKRPRVPFEQLVNLSTDTPFRLAHVRLCLAQTYPDPSAERSNYLATAAKGFEFYTREGFSESELTIRAHLGLAECRRLERRFDDALRALAPVEQSQIAPPVLKDEALAIHMNALLDQDQPQAAKALVKGRTKLSAEMALAQVRATLIEAGQAAARGDVAAAAQLQADALDRIAVGEREFSPGWALRADLVLGRHGNPDWLAANLDASIRLAEALQRAGRPGAAAIAFRRAARLAREARQPGPAFGLASKGAIALGQAGKNVEAAEELLALLAENPGHEKAAPISLLAAHALRRAWDQDRRPQTLQRLKLHVADHLKRYPGDESTGDVYFLAGYVESMADRKWQAAIDHFSRVPIEHRLFAAALQEQVRAIEACQSHVAAEESERLRRGVLDQIARHEQSVAARPMLAGLRSELALAKARLLCRPAASKQDLQEARALLSSLPQSNLDADRRQFARQTLLLVLIALGDRGDRAEALKAVEAAAAEPEGPAVLTNLLQRLAAWPPGTSPDRQQALAAVQLAIVQKLSALEPAAAVAQRREWRRTEANALVMLGRYVEARRLFDELRQASPSDLRLMEDHAHALMRMGQANDWKGAVHLWQTLASGRKEGTAEWLEAKYQLGTALHGAGEGERALKVVRVTYELWLRDAGTDAARQSLQQRFRELESRLQSK